MDPQTEELRQRLREHPGNLEAQLRILHNAYAGQTLYILSCGPSLRDHAPALLRHKLARELVFTVKQAENHVPGVADFHLLNTCNSQKYLYPQRRPITVLERPIRGLRVFGPRPDLVIPITKVSPHMDRQAQLNARLVVTKDFDAWTFQRSILRPWGPSILLELGIYLALHLGVGRIVVVGWDLDDPARTAYTHFYEERPERWAAWHKRVRELLPMRAFGFVGWIRHHLGMVYNKCYVEPDETRRVIEASGPLYQWLANQGVSLELASERSHLDPRIPRIRL
ncbi:MAG: hypothetical protein JJU36_14530 [Phycisphaeraceae bacterium]|nr:hypothetical protein [Phycisphaeraceae bacterium]